MDRKVFLEELKLRQEVRKIIKVVHRKKLLREQSQEYRFRIQRSPHTGLPVLTC